MSHNMKIGIISCFDINDVNYGNRLQALALNIYLRNCNLGSDVISLYFDNQECKEYKITSQIMRNFRRINGILCYKILPQLKGRFLTASKENKNQNIDTYVCQRLKNLNEFCYKNMNIPEVAWKWDDLLSSSFDAIVVGSDVVWQQERAVYSRRSFLDFELEKPYKKIAYAASFGRDYLPKENVKDIRRCLADFDGISLREKSSIEMLKKIGINDASHALDPTLLFTSEYWMRMENECEKIPDKYIFAYLLGDGKQEREQINRLSKKLRLPIVTIPYATGKYNEFDFNFGNIRVPDCGAREWLWLIDHAALIVTDSFHGTVFSVNFGKKFLVLKRQAALDINNRLVDFLATIGEGNKMINKNEDLNLDGMVWNYELIRLRLDEMRNESKKFLDLHCTFNNYFDFQN